jgi:diacylglycerol kinase family enzyme
MKKALLIYNPSSGRRREHRVKQVARALAVLRAAGVEAETCATTHRGSAVEQTREAVAHGFDTVIACGGDGTANEILNGLMLSGNSDAVLGVLPFGSGNLLATDLLLPHNPESAAQALLRYRPRALCPGIIRYQDKTGQQQRYFIVAAGVGCDADLMYRTAVEAKERYGMYAYFLEMFRMTLRGRFPLFKVEWTEADGNCHSGQVSMVMGIRSRKFPGVLQRVRLGSELIRNDYRLMLFHTGKVRHFLNYFASVASGLNWKVKPVELVYSTWFRCTPLPSQSEPIHSEVDGELLGTLPVEVGIEPRTFNLLMPD